MLKRFCGNFGVALKETSLKSPKLELSVGSKTFLIGEYGALEGGPALLCATEPQFVLKVYSRDEGARAKLAGDDRLMGFHAESPAARFMGDQPKFFFQYALEFVDPWSGRGGFGASSAQFLLCYALTLRGMDNGKGEGFASPEFEIDTRNLLEVYRSYSWKGEGLPPSGFDLLAQLSGGFSVVERSEIRTVLRDWPFKDLNFRLLHTGRKVATHEHLRSLRALPTEALSRAAEQAISAFAVGDSEEFVAALDEFYHILLEARLVSSQTQELVEQLQSLSGVLMAKGCGALGGDVLLVLQDPGATPLDQWARSHNLWISPVDQKLAPAMTFSLPGST